MVGRFPVYAARQSTSTPRARRILAGWALLGPAFVAAIAYVDPGNVAANVSAGARYGYLLVWVIVGANAMAGMVQYLSAKLGVVSGLSLPEAMRDRLPDWLRLGYWAQAELIAMATDLAEVIGGAIALRLLFGIPLLAGGVLTGLASLLILAEQNRRGQRAFERMVLALLAIIVLGFLGGMVVARPSVSQTVAGLVPRFHGGGSVALAAAILGATVMPHVVYLHSGLTRDRFGHTEFGPARRRLLRATKFDVIGAMIIAGAVNLSMLLLAARVLRGHAGVDTIDGVHAALAGSLGAGVALLFAIGLLASGLASTSVGAHAGAQIMQGLLRRRVPLLVRRVITLLPALVLLGANVDPTRALLVSQVVLSFGIPFALIPLVWLTARYDVMGHDVNRPTVTGIATAIAAIVVALNVFLIYQTIAQG